MQIHLLFLKEILIYHYIEVNYFNYFKLLKNLYFILFLILIHYFIINIFLFLFLFLLLFHHHFRHLHWYFIDPHCFCWKIILIFLTYSKDKRIHHYLNHFQHPHFLLNDIQYSPQIDLKFHLNFMIKRFPSTFYSLNVNFIFYCVVQVSYTIFIISQNYFYHHCYHFSFFHCLMKVYCLYFNLYFFHLIYFILLNSIN